MIRIAAVFLLALFAIEAHAQKASDVVVTVNKQPLTREALEAYKRSAPPGNVPPDDRAIDLLINIEVLYQEAKKRGMDKTPEFLADVENQKRNILARALMSKALQDKPITDAELQQGYQKRLEQMPRKEYKLSHIVSNTEDEAKTVVADLDKGQSFADVARAKSIDADTRDKGGSLRWLDFARLPEVRKAVDGLAPTTYTKAPVKTDMGWHVFMLEGVRDIAPPPFDAVKAQLRASLESDRVNAYVADVRKNATVELTPPK